MTTTNKVDWNAEVAQAVLAMKEEGQKAYTYMKSEAPEIAREYVRWRLAESLAYSAGWLIPITFLAVTGKWFLKKAKADPSEPWAVGAFACFAVSVFMLAEALPRICAALKCLVAPRIVIIEGIKSIVQ
mgnify:CR=1 FL=1